MRRSLPASSTMRGAPEVQSPWRGRPPGGNSSARGARSTGGCARRLAARVRRLVAPLTGGHAYSRRQQRRSPSRTVLGIRLLFCFCIRDPIAFLFCIRDPIAFMFYMALLKSHGLPNKVLVAAPPNTCRLTNTPQNLRPACMRLDI
jgi:hypothetical protein